MGTDIKTRLSREEALDRHHRVTGLLDKVKTMFDISLLGDLNDEQQWNEIQEKNLMESRSRLLMTFCILIEHMDFNTPPEDRVVLDEFYDQMSHVIQHHSSEFAILLGKFTTRKLRQEAKDAYKKKTK